PLAPLRIAVGNSSGTNIHDTAIEPDIANFPN
ncbi:unnamed protein product, partial [Rotaria socialis]